MDGAPFTFILQRSVGRCNLGMPSGIDGFLVLVSPPPSAGAVFPTGEVDMTVNRLLCFFNRHEPVRTDVRWDGSNYVGSCRLCGEKIRRQKHNLWRLEWLKGL